MGRTIPITNFVRSGVFLLGLVACVLWLTAMLFDFQYFYAAGGLMVLFVSVFPIASLRKYDCFCPWSGIVLGVLYGCTVPSLCMTFNIPSEEFVDQEILLGKRPHSFIWSTLLIICTIACVSFGYFCCPFKDKQYSLTRVSNARKVVLTSLVCCIISVVTFSVFFQENGGIENGISTKRLGNSRSVANGRFENHLGHLRHIAKVGTFAFLLLGGQMCLPTARGKQWPSLLSMTTLFFLFVTSMVLPFYSSSRSGIVWILIGLLGILYYSRKRIFSARVLLAMSVVFSMVLFATLSRNREASSERDTLDRIGMLLLNRHGPDLAVTSHVMNSIPGELEFQYGKTVSRWLIAPIPRRLMPHKPVVHVGPQIGEKIYHLNGSGVPPGITADLFWNFHIPGVVCGAIMMGMFIRMAYNKFRNLAADPVLVVPVYLFVVFPIGFKLVTHSVGCALVTPFIDLGFACAVVFNASNRTAARNRRPQ